MNSDPLQRRMFAQQILARHARANQPMGILASSPQLMGAVQGFKDGGAVKGYEAGGFEDKNVRFPRENLKGYSGAYTIEDQLAIEKRKKEDAAREKLNPSFGEPGQRTLEEYKADETTTEYDVKPKLNNPILNKPSKNDQEANTFSVGAKPDLQGVDGYGTEINDKNKSLLDGITEYPDAGNKGAKLDKNTDSTFATEPENPYENLDKKYATKLKKANALFDKATNDPKVTNEWKEKVEEIYNKEGEIDLEKIDKLAKEGAGIGDDNYDKRRSTAFWMGLIKGGLATAAGESSNALTNIAKGLMFGVDSFGKDINAINEDEREDRKEYGKLKVDLIKSEESKLLAHKSLELQYASKMYEIKQNQNNFESKMDFQKAQAKINNELQFETMEISRAKAWNDIKWKSKTYDLQLKEFALNKEKQADYVRLTTQQLNDAWNKGLLTDDMKEVIGMGDEYINVDPKTGKFKSFTDLGKKALVTAKLTGNKITDLNTVGNGYVALGSVLGVKFLKEDGTVNTAKTKAAGLVWQESFADKWQKIQVKKGSGTLDLKGQKAEEQRVLEDFAKMTGGSYTAPSQTYDINGNPIN